MKKHYRHSLYLQMFNEEVPVENTGVEEVPAAEEQATEATQTEDKTAVAFAKKWAAKEKEWQEQKEAEIQALKDQYKDHETYRKAAEYLQKTSGINDMLTLKEQIELEELQERAEQENVPPSVLKRIDELEAKAKEADELKAQMEQAKQAEQFETTLKTFCEGKELDGKPLDHQELWKYMAENEVVNPDIAYKAMKADLLEAQVAEAKKKGVEEYLASKTGVKTNSGAAASSIPSGGGWEGARARALARIQANK